jgi:transcriptional regulator with XRE-family HTH domain
LQDIYSFVGQRIRAERKSRKLTLEELASAVGMNTSFLHQIETAKKKPSLRKVQEIAEALRIPVARLFEGVKPSRQEDPFIGKLTVLVKDADDPRRKTILKVVKELAKGRR